jgi:prepilin-type N-terminal cleavage/methylation domain-containing protein
MSFIKEKKRGFSLAEMMVVMLLVAVVLVATAPMITRKVARERSDKIWDMLNVDPPNAVEYIKGRNQRLYMNSRTNGYVGIREAGDSIPMNSVIFGKNKLANETTANVTAVGFETETASNSVAVGYNISAATRNVVIGNNSKGLGNDHVVIGYNALARDNVDNTAYGSVAIGYYARAYNIGAIGIGYDSKAYANNTIAIGYNSKADHPNSTAIGYNAKAKHPSSTAVGANAKSTDKNQIVLGTENDTVYIPGNLVVGHFSYLGADHKPSVNGHFLPLFVWGSRQNITKNPGMHQVKVRSTNWNTHDDEINLKFSIDTTEVPYSDIRLKNIGKEYTDGLNKINELKVFNFTFKDDKNKTPQVGVIAQDLQKTFPNAVSKAPNGYLQIRWDEMFYTAINAIKELNTKISVHIENLQKLTDEVKVLKSTVEKQEVIIDKQQTEIKDLISRIEKLEKEIK